MVRQIRFGQPAFENGQPGDSLDSGRYSNLAPTRST